MAIDVQARRPAQPRAMLSSCSGAHPPGIVPHVPTSGPLQPNASIGQRATHMHGAGPAAAQPFSVGGCRSQVPGNAILGSALCVPVASESQPVVAFLGACGLQEYALPLIQNGFDDMETLLCAEEADLTELGFQPHHAAYLRRKLQDIGGIGSVVSGPEVDLTNPVVAFLEEHGLSQYSKLLLANGFDEMDTLLEAEVSDLKELGMVRGHILKLSRHLREYQLRHEGQEVPPMPLAQLRQRRAVRVAMSAPARPPQLAPPCRMPTEQMKSAVERSWEQVQSMGSSTVGELLYKYTFELAPEAIDIFPISVRRKYRQWTADEKDDDEDVWLSSGLKKLFGRIVNAVGCAVVGLHDPSKLVPMLTSLGMRHSSYGVQEAFWPVLGKALIRTLREMLGQAFTAEVEVAWTIVYGFMSSIMMEGLRSVQQAALLAGSARVDDLASQSSGCMGQGASSEVHMVSADDSRDNDAHTVAGSSTVSCGRGPMLQSMR